MAPDLHLRYHLRQFTMSVLLEAFDARMLDRAVWAVRPISIFR